MEKLGSNSVRLSLATWMEGTCVLARCAAWTRNAHCTQNISSVSLACCTHSIVTYGSTSGWIQYDSEQRSRTTCIESKLGRMDRVSDHLQQRRCFTCAHRSSFLVPKWHCGNEKQSLLLSHRKGGKQKLFSSFRRSCRTTPQSRDKRENRIE